MINGIYFVSFQSSLATVGEGFVVFDDCGIHGANDGHFFRGRQIKDCGQLMLDLEIVHLSGDKYPSFGPLDRVHLDLTVTERAANGFRARGIVREQPAYKLNVRGKLLGELMSEACPEQCANGE